MPRIRQYSDQYAMSDFVTNIRKASIDMGLKNCRAISDKVGIPYGTMVTRLNHPETFKLDEIVKIIRVLRLDSGVMEPLFRGGCK